MKYKAIEFLYNYDYLGKSVLEDGTTLIGKAPHIAPQAWLHSIYPGLSNKEIDDLQDDCNHIIPDSYRKFLLTTNGLGVFNTTLSLYGKRKNHIRTVANVWQPFDIVTPNTIERPKNARHDILIIGSYSYDGSKLYIDNITQQVHLCERYDAASLYVWESFEAMLSSEVKRLMTLFDKEGKKIVRGKSTLPTG